MNEDSMETIPHSTQDVLRFFQSSKKQNDKESDKPVKPFADQLTEIDFNSDYYNMTHPKRGLAIIFNHYAFDDYNLKKREGTMKDGKDLESILKTLQFEVKIYQDLKFGAIFEVLTGLAEANHADSDCLLIAVLSHGEVGKVHAKDHAYSVDMLWKRFAGDECKTLAGKPKIFFIQACRGDGVDGGTEVRSRIETDSAPNPIYKIPAMADFLVMYSTYDGFYSWRSPITGSWFIQSLCQELKEHAKHRDLHSVLTLVNRRMALQYKSNVPGNPRFHDKKQVGTIVSTLTRFLHFNLKEN